MRIVGCVIGVFCWAAVATAQPQNDQCRDATAVGEGQTPFDTSGASTDGPAEPGCGFCCEDDQINQDIWFEYEAPESRAVVISLCGSGFDTKIGVYEQRCPGGPGEILVCNDDFIDCGLQSQVRLSAVQGTRYLIRVGGFQAEFGPGTLTISPEPDPPAHDLCENAIRVETNEVFNGDTRGATGEDVTSCALDDAADVWHRWRAAEDGVATFSLCGSAFDTTLAVFDACGGGELACNDDECELSSLIELPVAAGVDYVLRVSGFNGQTGTYSLEVTFVSSNEGACCLPDGSCTFGTRQECDDQGGNYTPARTCEQVLCPPGNDACEDFIEVFDGVTEFDNLGATTDGPSHLLCENAGSDQVDSDIWFSYVATATGRISVSTCQSADYDTKIAAYAGLECPVSDERLLACNDDFEGCDLTSVIEFDAICREEYLIRVGGFRDSQGSGTLTITSSGECIPLVDCDKIRKFKAKCGNGTLKASVKTRLEPGTILTVDNNGEQQTMRINNRGKSQAVFREQSGPHTVLIVECPEHVKNVDCG